MNNLTNITKHTLYQVYKTSVILFCCVTVILLTPSCQKNNTEDLKILFLNNTKTNPELRKFLKKASNNIVSLQFYHNKNGDLTLDAWPAKPGTDNDEDDATILNTSGITQISLKNIKTHLANLELDADNLNSLKSVLEVDMNEFIVFVPKTIPISKCKANYITYNIYGLKKMPSGSDFKPDSLLTKDPITTTRNPSPPR